MHSGSTVRSHRYGGPLCAIHVRWFTFARMYTRSIVATIAVTFAAAIADGHLCTKFIYFLSSVKVFVKHRLKSVLKYHFKSCSSHDSRWLQNFGTLVVLP